MLGYFKKISYNIHNMKTYGTEEFLSPLQCKGPWINYFYKLWEGGISQILTIRKGEILSVYEIYLTQLSKIDFWSLYIS